MKQLLSLLVLLLLLGACTRRQEDVRPQPVQARGEGFKLVWKGDYVEGDLLVGFSDTTSIKTIFEFTNALNLQISKTKGFHYMAPLPEKKMPVLISLLQTRPYLSLGDPEHSVFYSKERGGIILNVRMQNMNRAAQQDWLNTMRKLQLRPHNTLSLKGLTLKVPAGTERYWQQELRQYQVVKWVELNQVFQVERRV